MSDAVDHAVLEGEEAAQAAPPRRGRPPRTPAEVAMAAGNAAAIAEGAFVPAEPQVQVIISVKPSEWWRCPYVEDGHGGTRITTPREHLMVPISLARFMEKNEQAVIVKGND